MSRESNRVHIDDVEKAKRIQERSDLAFRIMGRILMGAVILGIVGCLVLFIMWNWGLAAVVVGILALVGIIITWSSSISWADQTLRDADFYGVRDD